MPVPTPAARVLTRKANKHETNSGLEFVGVYQLMRQMADLTGTPIEHMSGDAVAHHLRHLYAGTLILNVGINADHGARLISEGVGNLIAFGRITLQIRILSNAYALTRHSMSRDRNISMATRQRVLRTILV